MRGLGKKIALIQWEQLWELNKYKRKACTYAHKEEELRERSKNNKAEEARKLKMEKLQLSSLETRQRKRTEELRESQNLEKDVRRHKERIRESFCLRLQRLEKTLDSTAFLRELGVQIEDHTPHGLKKAFKVVLAKCHPDKAPRDNLQQQVEFEERFKVISCMRKKHMGS